MAEIQELKADIPREGIHDEAHATTADLAALEVEVLDVVCVGKDVTDVAAGSIGQRNVGEAEFSYPLAWAECLRPDKLQVSHVRDDALHVV